MKKVAILSNDHSWTYNLRKELIENLLNNRYKVIVILPYGEKVDKMIEMGCDFINVKNFERRGKNPLKEVKLIIEYYIILNKLKPDFLLTYTIKPNLYGGLVARIMKIPYMPNITGLGSAICENPIIKIITLMLYRFGLKGAKCIFAQNKGNSKFLIDNNIIDAAKVKLLPGSGVNLNKFILREYPDDSIIKFAFVSRILKEKGIEDYLDAAKIIREKYPDVEFHICGFCEERYEDVIREYSKNGIVIYHGMVDKVDDFYASIHCLVHPSYYYEGISNVCLEASSTGRPVITTDHEGCRETVVDGYSGYIVQSNNPKELAMAMERFIKLSWEEKKNMGLYARNFVSKNYDRDIVVSSYTRELK